MNETKRIRTVAASYFQQLEHNMKSYIMQQLVRRVSVFAHHPPLLPHYTRLGAS
jgi:hypothetical protein